MARAGVMMRFWSPLAAPAGRIPGVVVLFDGVNEVAAARENGVAGGIQDEVPFARRFAEGRETGALTHLMRAGESLGLVKRLAMLRRPATGGRAAGPALCPQVAGQYVALTRAIAALGREFHFRPVFIWQPMLATTRKPLGPFERTVPDDPVLRSMLVRCSALVDSLMAGRRDAPFYDLRDVFDGDSMDVFWDHAGHVTEHGNQVIAERIARIIGPLVDSARSR